MPFEQVIIRPLLVDCPQLYQSDTGLIEAVNEGLVVSEQEALESYFYRLSARDTDYYHQVESLVTQRQAENPNNSELTSTMGRRQLQIIIPTYHESENIPQFLSEIEQQFDASKSTDWGLTIVLNYPTPYPKKGESVELRTMKTQIDKFLDRHPQYQDRIDTVTFSRFKDADPQIMPVAIARKIGEDVIMMEKLVAAQNGITDQKPLYLGLMDMDTSKLTPGLIDEMVNSLPETSEETPVIVRVQGSYDKNDLKNHPHLHILQEVWEGSISTIGAETKHNPFNMGRLSAIPAKEFAITGGTLSKQLNFTDEDIRHGLQIAWQLNNVKTVELNGKYSTSARREIDMMQGLLELLQDNNGVFNVETMECAALIRMYGKWSEQSFRKDFGNVLESSSFQNKDLPRLIEAMANAFYRFTLFGIYSVEQLSQSPLAPEVNKLKQQFLSGQIPYFEVQIQTHEFIKSLAENDPERFKQIKSILDSVNQHAKQTMSDILSTNNIHFEYENPKIPMLGFLEKGVEISRGTTADKIVLQAPFKINNNQSKYLEKIRQDLEES